MTTVRRRSQKQEARAAEAIGGRVTPGSGAGWAHKNDVKSEDLSVECKYTDNKSYSLKEAELLKAERQALVEGREFAFFVGFGKMSGSRKFIDREFVVISREYFEDLRSRGHSE